MGRRTSEQGSSLPEVMVASALLLLLLAPLVGLFAGARLTALDSGRKSGSTGVARTWMERFAAMEWASMDAHFADPASGFVEVIPGERWERDFAPDPDQPRFEVGITVQQRRLRPPQADDAMPSQLDVREAVVTVRWLVKENWFTVQQAALLHRR